jgi:hypothetical protein
MKAGHFEKIGDKGIRTPDLTGAIRALYQLSYVPEDNSRLLIIDLDRAPVSSMR